MIARSLERLIFASRWLLVPFYLGLIVALALLAFKFIQNLVALFPGFLAYELSDTIVASLKLVDLALTANLILMVVIAGYENFIARVEFEADDRRPTWMGKLDFGEIKMKLITSIVAISSIQVLEEFMDTAANKSDLVWLVAIPLTFVVSGVLLAVMDRIAAPHHD